MQSDHSATASGSVPNATQARAIAARTGVRPPAPPVEVIVQRPASGTPISLANAVAPPTAYAAPSQQPIHAAMPMQVMTMEQTVLQVSVIQVKALLAEAGFGRTTDKQADNIRRELCRMADANVLAKRTDRYVNDYRTWCHVNKQFYATQKEANEAWKVQKEVLTLLTKKLQDSLNMPKVLEKSKSPKK